MYSKGSNYVMSRSDQKYCIFRGEGLFPANFVSLDLDPEPERRKSVQFNEEVGTKY